VPVSRIYYERKKVLYYPACAVVRIKLTMTMGIQYILDETPASEDNNVKAVHKLLGKSITLIVLHGRRPKLPEDMKNCKNAYYYYGRAISQFS